MSSTDRCQAKETQGYFAGKQCALPLDHVCPHDFTSDPLTLGQALAWACELAMRTRDLRAENAKLRAVIERTTKQIRDAIDASGRP